MLGRAWTRPPLLRLWRTRASRSILAGTRRNVRSLGHREPACERIPPGTNGLACPAWLKRPTGRSPPPSQSPPPASRKRPTPGSAPTDGLPCPQADPALTTALTPACSPPAGSTASCDSRRAPSGQPLKNGISAGTTQMRARLPGPSSSVGTGGRLESHSRVSPPRRTCPHQDTPQQYHRTLSVRPTQNRG